MEEFLGTLIGIVVFSMWFLAGIELLLMGLALLVLRTNTISKYVEIEGVPWNIKWYLRPVIGIPTAAIGYTFLQALYSTLF